MCSVRITDSLWPERNIKGNPSCSLYNRNANVGYKVLYYLPGLSTGELLKILHTWIKSTSYVVCENFVVSKSKIFRLGHQVLDSLFLIYPFILKKKPWIYEIDFKLSVVLVILTRVFKWHRAKWHQVINHRTHYIK